MGCSLVTGIGEAVKKGTIKSMVKGRLKSACIVIKVNFS